MLTYVIKKSRLNPDLNLLNCKHIKDFPKESLNLIIQSNNPITKDMSLQHRFRVLDTPVLVILNICLAITLFIHRY